MDFFELFSVIVDNDVVESFDELLKCKLILKSGDNVRPEAIYFDSDCGCVIASLGKNYNIEDAFVNMSISPIREAHLKLIVEERGISKIVHFTNCSNIENIYTCGGILSKALLEASNSTYLSNDENRFDGREEYISTSIEEPNSFLFEKIKEKAPDEDFCLIEIDPRVIYELNCIFFVTNAANSDMSCMSVDEASSIENFEKIFADEVSYSRYYCGERYPNTVTRGHKANKLPTCKQAEVMIRDMIPLEYIKCIKSERWVEYKLYKKLESEGITIKPVRSIGNGE